MWMVCQLLAEVMWYADYPWLPDKSLKAILLYYIILWVRNSHWVWLSISPAPHALMRVTGWYSGGIWACLKNPKWLHSDAWNLSCCHVRPCATPQTEAHQAPPSLGFSRQEHWSGLPFPSPMHESEKSKWSHSVVSDPQQPHGLQPTRLLRPWDFPARVLEWVAIAFSVVTLDEWLKSLSFSMSLT